MSMASATGGLASGATDLKDAPDLGPVSTLVVAAHPVMCLRCAADNRLTGTRRQQARVGTRRPRSRCVPRQLRKSRRTVRVHEFNPAATGQSHHDLVDGDDLRRGIGVVHRPGDDNTMTLPTAGQSSQCGRGGRLTDGASVHDLGTDQDEQGCQRKHRDSRPPGGNAVDVDVLISHHLPSTIPVTPQAPLFDHPTTEIRRDVT